MTDDRPDRLVRALLELLAELDDRDGRTRRGRWSGDRTSVRYSVSVGGLDDADDAGPADPASPVVTTRSLADGLLVVADIPGVRAADVSVDLEPAGRTLTIAVDGAIVGDVPLEEGGWTVADVSFNNDVMEVQLTHD